MRIRNKPESKELLMQKDFFINDCKKYKGKWNEVFNNDNPIHLEIGMGKGDFIVGMANKNPDINYIGLELYPSVQIIGAKKIERNNLNNVILISENALDLEEIFCEKEIDLIYLNFSDPWPKSKHSKRRLTAHRFLDIYKNILSGKKIIHFKTDNSKLFEWSLEQFSNYGLLMKNISLDLHNVKDVDEWNIKTEYEVKFSSKDFKIKRVELQYDK